MNVGLTLGKFAPLHKGHQLVLNTAVMEMPVVIVLIYETDVTDVPLPVRASWIRRLYPRAEVIECWDGPQETGYTPEIMRTHEEYVLRRLRQAKGNIKVTHFYSSEPYGEHMSRALGAVDRRVDPDRSVVPVSGTEIRDDPYGHRKYIDPVVYRDLVFNVAILGAPSTGKSTIAEALAKSYDTVHMPEYGREYWMEHQVDHRLTATQLVDLAKGHIEREDAKLIEADEVLFTDTTAMTTSVFSRYYHGCSDPVLERLAREAQSRYDLVFLCDTDIPFDDTWDRSGAVSREVMQKMIVADLMMRKMPWVTLRGSVEERVERARHHLDVTNRKWKNPSVFFDTGAMTP